MAKKKPKPPQIEDAIGDRAKPKAKLSEANIQKVAQDVKEAVMEKVAQMENPGFPQNPSEIPDEPSPSEMLTLEELNRRTEARLQDETLDEKLTLEEHRILNQRTETEIPVSKPAPQPVTETCSQESPPQKIDEIDEYQDAVKGSDLAKSMEDAINEVGIKTPAEDVELTALREYIQEDGFVLSTVAFHIVTLCAQPMVTPSTTTWDFADRAEIPAMILALLNQPGYLDGIWPSLKIVMGSNKGNAAWTAGISTTIAFFDVIRTLPALVELKNSVD